MATNNVAVFANPIANEKANPTESKNIVAKKNKAIDLANVSTDLHRRRHQLLAKHTTPNYSIGIGQRNCKMPICENAIHFFKLIYYPRDTHRVQSCTSTESAVS